MSKLTTGIGFHMAVNSNATGIGEYWKRLAAEGHAIVAKGVDNAGPAKEVQDLAKLYPDLQIDGIYRPSSFPWGDDVPNYSADPKIESRKFWEHIIKTWPPELDKEFVWVEFPNEADKNHSHFLGEFAYHAAQFAIENGYKFLSPGWSAGEPEPEHWRFFVDYLELCHLYPNQIGISVHEYSFSSTTKLLDHTPYLIGRIKYLNERARMASLNPPTIFITEFGYAYSGAPSHEFGVPDVIRTVDWYIKNYPNVRGVILWCLDKAPNWGNLPNIMNSYIKPLGNHIIATNWPVKEFEEVEQDKYKAVVFKVAQEHTTEDYLNIAGIAAKEYGRDLTRSHHTLKTILLDPSANNESYAVIWDEFHKSQQETIRVLEDLGIKYQTRRLINDPFEGLQFGFLFNEPYTLTSAFNDPRDYSALGGYEDDKHEGNDYDVLTAQLNSSASVLAFYPGEVISATSSPGYGKRVIVSSVYNGVQFSLTYAHLDEIYVSVGQKVGARDPIGEIGNTGNSYGEHVHVTMQSSGNGLDGYIVDSVLDFEKFCPHPHQKLKTIYPDNIQYDLYEYLIGGGTPYQLLTVLGPNSGAVETVQYKSLGEGKYAFVKNQQFELFMVDDEWIHRGLDTSPGGGRFYVQFQPGQKTTPWVKRFMSEGETSIAPNTHRVQFFNKEDCSKSAENSGWAHNVVKFANHFNEYSGIKDVVELITSTGESMFFAKGIGMIGWKSEWGESLFNGFDSSAQITMEDGCFGGWI